MFHHAKNEQIGFLPNLTKAFLALDPNKPLNTREFVEACAKVEHVFDHIGTFPGAVSPATAQGTVFLIAKHEFEVKRSTVLKVADVHPALEDIVAAGKQDGTVTIKNSPARNLHRLIGTVSFVSAIFKHLQAGKSLKDAVSDAYDETLGQLHSWVVRTGIKTGMLGLPSRDAFFTSIGETDASAEEHARGFTEAADAIVSSVMKLYDGVTIPKSDFSVKSLWS